MEQKLQHVSPVPRISLQGHFSFLAAARCKVQFNIDVILYIYTFGFRQKGEPFGLDQKRWTSVATSVDIDI